MHFWISVQSTMQTALFHSQWSQQSTKSIDAVFSYVNLEITLQSVFLGIGVCTIKHVLKPDLRLELPIATPWFSALGWYK